MAGRLTALRAECTELVENSIRSREACWRLEDENEVLRQRIRELSNAAKDPEERELELVDELLKYKRKVVFMGRQNTRLSCKSFFSNIISLINTFSSNLISFP